MSQGKQKNRSHWNPSHPGEVARDKLRKEIKAGRIVKPDICQLCDSVTNEIIGHHWRGYAYPFDVWWICRSCNTHPQLKHDGSQSLEQARAIMNSVKSPHSKKIDNSCMQAKLDLRRYFLNRYHVDQSRPIHVLDCCQGSGLIWSALKAEYDVTSYWGVDVKPKAGRLKLDSRRILAQAGWPQNVIDVDTYGSPWGHWLELLPHVTQPTTVFMTIGDQNSGVFQPGPTGANYLTLPPSTPGVLQGMIGRDIAPNILLTRAAQFGINLIEPIEAIADGQHARYIGCHLVPSKPCNQ